MQTKMLNILVSEVNFPKVNESKLKEGFIRCEICRVTDQQAYSCYFKYLVYILHISTTIPIVFELKRIYLSFFKCYVSFCF